MLNIISLNLDFCLSLSLFWLLVHICCSCQFGTLHYLINLLSITSFTILSKSRSDFLNHLPPSLRVFILIADSLVLSVWCHLAVDKFVPHHIAKELIQERNEVFWNDDSESMIFLLMDGFHFLGSYKVPLNNSF